jgi:tryptophanyl-tRNA synthetase
MIFLNIAAVIFLLTPMNYSFIPKYSSFSKKSFSKSILIRRSLPSHPKSPEPAVKRILSGVQPTGTLHLGNYLGAIKQWVQYQDSYESYFCVVDLHAITLPQDPKLLKQGTLQAAAMYLACGIDPKKSKIFIQSHIPAHSELCWLLNCITPMGWLERMIQFKEKSAAASIGSSSVNNDHIENNIGVGLFDYPVLMAADILLYQASLVPVGDDQKQHIELTRDLVRRFHDKYCSPSSSFSSKSNNSTSDSSFVFQSPKPLILKDAGSRIMSLLDGNSKMSKSAINDNSRINLLDSPDIITKKIKRCKTDPIIGLEWNNPQRPEARNLLGIYQLLSGKSLETVIKEMESMSWGQFKPILADAIIEQLKPIQSKYSKIINDIPYLESVLEDGRQSANEIAENTLSNVKLAMGFHLPPSSSISRSASSSVRRDEL